MGTLLTLQARRSKLLGLLQNVQIFAGLEADRFAGRDGDFGSGARVPAHAGLARFDGEDPETAEFDAIPFGERLLHGLENGIDGRLGLGTDEPGPFHHALDEILFDQLVAFRADCR